MSDSGATKQLPARVSRGSRINKLLGEEAEADDAFWNQEAWNEEGEDSDYATEAEEEDVIDSDFDEDEDPDVDVHDSEDDEGGAKRKRGRPARDAPAKRRAYQEPQQQAQRPRRAPATGTATAKRVSTDGGAVTAVAAAYEAPKLRHSTARKSVESSDLRRKILEEASRLAAKAKKVHVVKARFTQEQLLEEAVRTEVENVQSLNRLERLEEEKKAENVITPKAPYTGLIVRYHSRIGAPKTITFLNTSQFPAIFDQQPPRRRERTGPNERTGPKEEPVEDDEDEDDNDEDEGEANEDANEQDTGEEEAEDTQTADEEEGDTTADDDETENK